MTIESATTVEVRFDRRMRVYELVASNGEYLGKFDDFGAAYEAAKEFGRKAAAWEWRQDQRKMGRG